jgi:hypothetical protein
MKKFTVISEFLFKNHNKIYKPNEKIELTDKEAGIVKEMIKDFKEYKRKPIKEYLTK